MRSAIAALFVFGSIAVAATYDVAPASGTKLELKVDKTGLYRGKTHVFLFEKYRGKLDFDAQTPGMSKIDLTIESGSAVCTDDWVSAGDLKKVMEETFGNMLAVKQFPTMNFTSTAIKPLGGNKFEVQGILTIRNKPKPVTVNVTLDPADPAVLRLSGDAKIHLKDYGLKPPSAALGLIGTKEEMSLEFKIVATPAD